MLDERDGDEGGIDIDMVEYYEQAMHKNGGFENATSAISAALKENQVPVTENNIKVECAPKTQEVGTVSNCQDDDVEMMEEDDTPQVNKPIHSEVPPSTETVAEPVITVCQTKNTTTEGDEDSPATEEEHEQKEESSSLESVTAAVRPIAKPKRSNIRTSWDSPNTAGSAPMIKRSMARRSCNK